MIRILTGRPEGAGEALINEAARALKSGAGDVYVIVPKQLTLQTELTLIRALEPGGSFRLNVLSPERLCTRIFETAGRPTQQRVDDRGRVMLARRALNACAPQLSVYSGAGHRRGFPARARGGVAAGGGSTRQWPGRHSRPGLGIWLHNGR